MQRKDWNQNTWVLQRACFDCLTSCTLVHVVVVMAAIHSWCRDCMSARWVRAGSLSCAGIPEKNFPKQRRWVWRWAVDAHHSRVIVLFISSMVGRQSSLEKKCGFGRILIQILLVRSSCAHAIGDPCVAGISHKALLLPVNQVLVVLTRSGWPLDLDLLCSELPISEPKQKQARTGEEQM